ncbi:Uncharacterised protein [Starkeya nomas]|uniref:DUF4760 domain-containing protein n=1 Tax=Starkeya nomas TaxID=2666134 RepID=A0A5S9R5Z9_9HYPH|nr:hypothetical protein [Starkeya nomas]CAA0129804.1 Uncharacterised protein [Starkeya nomas]
MCAGCEAFSWGQWFYDWQTLISGALALAAALIAAILLHRQNWLTKRQMADEKDRRATQQARKAMALRSKMHIMLDSVGAFAKASFMWTFNPTDTSRRKLGEPAPDLPVQAIAGLAELIEHVDEKTAGWIAELLRLVQTFSARLPNREYEIDFLVRDAIAIQSMVDAAYPYAWRLTATYDPTGIDVENIQRAFDTCAKAYLGRDWPDHISFRNHRVQMVRDYLELNFAAAASAGETPSG